MDCLIHLQGILQNDLKTNNIALSDCVPQAAKRTSKKLELWPTTVDFSKACPKKDGKKYHLLPCETETFKTHYPHLAPDLVDGKVRQNVFSDIFSFGQVILNICFKSTIAFSTWSATVTSKKYLTSHTIQVLFIIFPNFKVNFDFNSASRPNTSLITDLILWTSKSGYNILSEWSNWFQHTIICLASFECNIVKWPECYS